MLLVPIPTEEAPIDVIRTMTALADIPMILIGPNLIFSMFEEKPIKLMITVLERQDITDRNELMTKHELGY